MNDNILIKHMIFSMQIPIDLSVSVEGHRRYSLLNHELLLLSLLAYQHVTTIRNLIKEHVADQIDSR